MDPYADSTAIDALVARVLTIEDKTIGTPKLGYLLRYRGRLRLESEAAYDQLANTLAPQAITPLFRWDEGKHAVLLIDKPATPKETNPLLNLAFFIATLLSVFFIGVLNSGLSELPADPLQAAWAILQAGGPYTLALLGILGAHEFGHYLVGRAHGVRLTLPFFIPIPIPGSLGTMGAFINMKEQPRNRRHLLDIGLAGPLAGVVVAIFVLLIGLSLSPVQAIVQAPAGSANMMEGNSILYLALKFIVKGQLCPPRKALASKARCFTGCATFSPGGPSPWARWTCSYTRWPGQVGRGCWSPR
jgi:hypothetical protein